MCTLVLIVIAGLVLIVAYCLVWMNRDSPAVVGAAIPNVIALASALAMVFVFNRPAPISRVFQVVLVVEKASLLPVMVSDIFKSKPGDAGSSNRNHHARIGAPINEFPLDQLT
ncbi:MAG TPA: hypothetical protein VK901_01080 [Nitrospiraceae bacterium]|nr:hypothetical protein [Nitrospiraceae bacterium]